ncbi:MAG: glycerol-3-phosphate dehydrogenase, partial [Hyphomicrobiales bacterium]|nr:glycerol-3-phosphate dehydrogenase [Hyphomicrobiales bacterium]
MAEAEYDIAIIGGGINGCGIARDAAGRGYSVLLCEQDDFASGTSSVSTKLIHGGLRYLEFYEFRLVREALVEREVLWAMAPHIIRPLRFILPHHKGLRPAWLLRLGLFIYDHLGGRKRLPGTTTIDLATDPVGTVLRPGYSKAFEYSDCWVDDARLVVLNACDAADRDAVLKTRTRVTSARREGGIWAMAMHDSETGATQNTTASLLVNAAGPWVDKVLDDVVAETAGQKAARNVRLIKGSHIVVRALFGHEKAYFFQNADGRIIFAIPYERDFTLIGTTDENFAGDPSAVAISDDEIDYLCAAASEYFSQTVKRDSIVWTFSGVRPLFDDGASKAQEVTREYILRTDGDAQSGALINIFGGKITTYRRLAEAAMAMAEDILGERGPKWTSDAKLPGGDFAVDGFDAEVQDLRRSCPVLEDDHARRLVRAYGTRARRITAGVTEKSHWGESFGADLTEREVRYLIDEEWARTAEDVLWRRSKLGLRFSDAETARLDA